MGFILQTVTIEHPEENITVSNAYVAIAHYDIIFRNYKPELIPEISLLIPCSNDSPIYNTSLPLAGKSLLVNYGIWESYESRIACERPLTLLTIQITGISTFSYETVYSLLKEQYTDSIDF